MKKISHVLCVVLILTLASSVLPLSAYGFAASDAGYERSYESIRKVVHEKGASAELDISLYTAQAIALEVMNECELIEFIHDSRMSPDQSMVFISYFLKDEPGKLRVIYLRRPAHESRLHINNDTMENFSEFAHKHYKTRFYYIERTDGSSTE